MEPRIETLSEKKLVGTHIRMSLAHNKTGELWRSFMPRRREIKHIRGTELYSLEVFDPHYFEAFNPEAPFTKWAAVEVSDWETIPEGMHTLTVQGLYAVFLHKGPASEGPTTYRYIFETWLPASKFEVDNRPHFAVMGEKYKHDDPASEEEIWVPVKEIDVVPE